MPDLRSFLTCFLVLLLPNSALAVDVVLKNNPFERPDISVTTRTDHGTTVKTSGMNMSLRATMAAGEHSLANIGGEIIGIGEQINGYKLVAVHARHVVLEKNEIQKTLSIDNETESAK